MNSLWWVTVENNEKCSPPVVCAPLVTTTVVLSGKSTVVSDSSPSFNVAWNLSTRSG